MAYLKAFMKIMTVANQKSSLLREEQKPPSKTPVAHTKASAPKALPAHSL
jgi:hypothetical protein